MKTRANIIITNLLLIFSTYSYGQMEQYNYKRELQGITDQWHKIVLPNEIFEKTTYNLSDIKIMGITKNNDTIEAPYLLQIASEKISNNDVYFKLINESRNCGGYYYTFEIPSDNPINKINLDFNEQNFDWKLKLEGSHNQQEWFTIIDDYRILSIKNSFTDYSFAKLNFPSSKYRFFRLMVDNHKDLIKLNAAKISLYEVSEGIYRDYTILARKTIENKQNKQTEIDIKLESPLPVSYLKIDVKNTYDYYRPISIKYLTDSFKTQNGWKYNYTTLTSGTLTSIEKNEFKFNSTILKYLKIIIHNNDNEALTIDTIKVKGYVHELVARFTEPANYFLMYGNNNAEKSYYDINHFADNIPDKLKSLTLGNKQIQDNKVNSEIEPLFENKTWLWAIMTIIILLLLWFSIKMIKKK